MEKDEERKEYVSNETGRVWIGENARPWYYAQFEEECYEVRQTARKQEMSFSPGRFHF